jgi:hypothetical protein
LTISTSQDDTLFSPQQASIQTLFDELESTTTDARDDLSIMVYHTKPLAAIPSEEAIPFCQSLFAKGERFETAFYRYWREVLHQDEALAEKNTQEELQLYLNGILNNLNDPHYHTTGIYENGHYIPIGLYGFRGLSDHSIGRVLETHLNNTGDIEKYSGKLSMAHAFSALNGYRNRGLLKYTFVLMALEALQQGDDHIFFFSSDHHLGPLYKRFGMDFPSFLKLPDSHHLVGSFTLTPLNKARIRDVALACEHHIPDVLLACVQD